MISSFAAALHRPAFHPLAKFPARPPRPHIIPGGFMEIARRRARLGLLVVGFFCLAAAWYLRRMKARSAAVRRADVCA